MPKKGMKLGPFSLEHRKKLSLAKLGKPSPQKGTTRSPEACRNISEGLKRAREMREQEGE
jgi:hypothetical protein